MARIRSIHPNACTSEKLARTSGDEERCYWRLQTHCDDDGRCEDHPRLIWAALFPLHEDVGPADVDKWLEGLAELGLLVRYEVDGKRYLEVTMWGDFQHPNRPTPSKLPPAPCALTADSLRGHGGVDAGVGEGEGDVSLALVVEQAPPSDPVVAVFEAWQEATGHHKAILDKPRRAAIVKARKHYPDEDLIDACRGVMLSPHNTGGTNGQRYDAITLILRDSEHIERFRDLARNQQSWSPALGDAPLPSVYTKPECPLGLCGGSGNVTDEDQNYLGRCKCVGGPIDTLTECKVHRYA